MTRSSSRTSRRRTVFSFILAVILASSLTPFAPASAGADEAEGSGADAVAMLASDGLASSSPTAEGGAESGTASPLADASGGTGEATGNAAPAGADAAEGSGADATSAAASAADADATSAAASAADADAAAANAAEGYLDIVHINDIHGRYSVSGVDGTAINAFATLSAYGEAIDADLMLDAGDTFHGDAFATVTEGESIARLLEAAGIDATTPGNHDWSYGAARLKELDEEHRFSILAANVMDDDAGEDYFPSTFRSKDIALEDADGKETGETITVGIVGVIDESFYSSTPARNVEGLSFADPVETATETARYMRAAGIDIVVCLTHTADPEGFAASVAGVDVVIAGHEHVAKDATVTAADGREVPVVEAPSSPSTSYFGSIGLLSLGVTETSDGAYAVTSHDETQTSTAELAQTYGQDAEVVALANEIVAENARVLDEVVGRSSREYPYAATTAASPGGWELVRTEDTPIGHVVTGSYLAQTGADLAFENAGGIRAGVPEGDVTVRDLVSISPYGNTLATYQLTGAQIRATIEHSLSISKACRDVLALQLEAIAAGEDPFQYSWPRNSGSVLAVGGATMEIDWDRPDGERIRSITVGGAPLQDDAVYDVAMNSYVAGSVSEYPAFSTMQLQKEWGTCEQALRALIAQDGWEQLMADLTGTITYTVPGTDDPKEPGTDPVAGTAAGTAPSSLAKSGDGAQLPLLLAVVGALGATCCLATARRRELAIARRRERRAACTGGEGETFDA